MFLEVRLVLRVLASMPRSLAAAVSTSSLPTALESSSIAFFTTYVDERERGGNPARGDNEQGSERASERQLGSRGEISPREGSICLAEEQEKERMGGFTSKLTLPRWARMGVYLEANVAQMEHRRDALEDRLHDGVFVEAERCEAPAHLGPRVHGKYAGVYSLAEATGFNV
jgi:hypothetical protein